MRAYVFDTHYTFASCMKVRRRERAGSVVAVAGHRPFRRRAAGGKRKAGKSRGPVLYLWYK